MAARAAFIATLSGDGKTVTMTKGAWSKTIEVSVLDLWLQTYERLWSRGAKVAGQPGKSAEFYDGAVKALRVIQRQRERIGAAK